MGHRHMFFASQLSDMDNVRNWNHQHPDPRFTLENGSFVLPIETVTISGVNSMACFNVSLRSNDLPSSNLSLAISNYRAASSGFSRETHLHPSAAGSSSGVLPNYVQHGPTYDQFTTAGVSSSVYPHMDFRRAPSKRKVPAFSMACDGGSTSGHQIAGSYSNLPAPSFHFQPEPGPGSRCWPTDPISMEPTYGGNSLLIPGDRSQRNVRSRHGHIPHLEINSSGGHPSSNLPHHISTASTPGMAVAGQWGHTPVVSLDSHRMMPSSGITCFRHEMSQPLAGSSVANRGMVISGEYHSNPVLIRDPSTLLPTLHTPCTRGMGQGHSGYGQRITPYRSTPSYQPMGLSAYMEDGRPTGVGAVVPLRHSRPPLPIVGRSSERAGRARNIYGRFQSFSEVDSARNRLVPEGIAMMDHRSTFYDSESLFDQHRDMRLDVDSMSYEELLALGERIGNVSTGLSDDTASKCLTEMVYCSDEIEGDDAEANCVICMEEYKDRDGLGRLMCSHDFHSRCIKKWLLIKNVCPICKASAVGDDDALREK